MNAAVDFETYSERMSPIVKHTASRRALSHPLLGYEDLVQEGLTALWRVWQEQRERLPFDQLCRVGTVAIRRRVRDVVCNAHAPHTCVSALCMERAEPASYAELSDWRAAGPDDTAAMAFVQIALREAAQVLTELERDVLRDVLAPSARTVRALQTLWGQRAKRVVADPHVGDAAALATLYGVPVDEIEQALEHVQTVLAAVLPERCAPPIYSFDSQKTQTAKSGEGGTMAKKAGGAVGDPFDAIGIEDDAEEPTRVKPARAVKAKAEKKAKPASNGHDAPRVAKASKPEKAARVAKAPKPEKPARVAKAKAEKPARAKKEKVVREYVGEAKKKLYVVGTKRALAFALLSREAGVSLDELEDPKKGVGWARSVCSGLLSDFRRDGYKVVKDEAGRNRI